MARQGRRTEPLETRTGVLHDYAAIEVLLSAGEMKGRQWVFERAVAVPRTSPTDHDIFDLHIAMFGDFLPWAGVTRLDDRGPGGKVPVSWSEVRVALRSFAGDLARWVVAVEPADLAKVASVMADAHHRFQWIHPFQDTNGRTGRVLDHYLLWVTFGLRGSSRETSPAIEYFPTEREENDYYEGLTEADLGRPERLHSFYVGRLVALFEAT